MTDEPDDVIIRPMTAADIPAAQEVSYTALREAGQRYGWEMPELDDAGRERGHRRLQHSVEHDAEGSWVADAGDAIVGVGISTKREKLWFLSLLTVTTEFQARGVGRRLLDATMTSLDDAGAICASDDPKALRRYRAAGFDLLPGYEASGPVDRSRLPAARGVRALSLDRDRELIEDVATTLRGAPHGPDLDYFASSASTAVVLDGRNAADGRGYAFTSGTSVAAIGATTPQAASALLVTLLAEADDELEVRWITHDQQWAIDVVLAAGMRLRPHGSRAVRNLSAPWSPYLPSGAFG